MAARSDQARSMLLSLYQKSRCALRSSVQNVFPTEIQYLDALNPKSGRLCSLTLESTTWRFELYRIRKATGQFAPKSREHTVKLLNAPSNPTRLRICYGTLKTHNQPNFGFVGVIWELCHNPYTCWLPISLASCKRELSGNHQILLRRPLEL